MLGVVKGEGAQEHDNQQDTTGPHIYTLAIIAFGAIAAVDQLWGHVHWRPVEKGRVNVHEPLAQCDKQDNIAVSLLDHMLQALQQQ